MSEPCQFRDTDPLHGTTFSCKLDAVKDGYCKPHQGSWHHVRALQRKADENPDRFFLTRDSYNEITQVHVRHCWTGTEWSGDLNEMMVFDSFRRALSEQFDVNDTLRWILSAPGVTIHPADIRKL